MTIKKQPHLIPQTLIGQRFPRNAFGDIKVALMGFCPPPSTLNNYNPQRLDDQHFIHISPDSLRILKHNTKRYLSLAHVYGGPVSSTTVEELAYYGIELILSYGLAGGLGTKGLEMGAFYAAIDAYAADGTTPHYSNDKIITADTTLCNKVSAVWSKHNPHTTLHSVRAATGDALYREHDAMLDHFRDQGCEIVNLDSAHLYAVAAENAEGREIPTLQCGVISDVIPAGPDATYESTLSTMLAEGQLGLNPLERTGDILQFYVENLAAELGY